MEHMSFKEALEKLTVVHDREVSELKAELAALKTKMPSSEPPLMMVGGQDESPKPVTKAEPKAGKGEKSDDGVSLRNSWTNAPPKFADSTKPSAMSEMELDLVKDLFKKCDKDNDNMLDYDEFTYMMIELGKQTHKKYSTSQVEKWFKRTDTDNSGRVDFDEFLIMQSKWAKLNRPVSRRVSASDAGTIVLPVEAEGEEAEGPVEKCLIHPSSTGRLVWDIAGMFLIAYDMVTIPMLAFSPADTTFTVFMGWLAMIFWTIDMGASVNTGIRKADGTVVMERKPILLQYLKTWFIVDLLVVVPDWSMTLLEIAGSGDGAGVARMTRMLRAFRAVRGLRLLRLAKLKKLLNYVYDAIDSEVMFLVLQLIQLIFIILFLNHYVACLWYAVGELTRGGGDYPPDKNWFDSGNSPIDEFDDLGWRYATSLHWSITQFTPASVDVGARNLTERVFSILVLFFAMMSVSSVIGSTSAAITQLRNMSGDRTKQFWLLRRYLKENKIDFDLRDRILRYAEFKADAAAKKTAPAKVGLLGVLSDPLKQEISTSLYSPTLAMHPFFGHLEEFMTKILRKVCTSAISQLSLAEHDVGFRANEEASSMFFLKGGRFDYTLAGQSQPRRPQLGAQEWLGEVTLWAKWRYRGDLVAAAVSDVLLLGQDAFAKVMQLHPRSWHFAQKYGTEVVKHMNTLDQTEMTDFTFDDDITSMVVPCDVYDDNGEQLPASKTSGGDLKGLGDTHSTLPGQILN